MDRVTIDVGGTTFATTRTTLTMETSNVLANMIKFSPTDADFFIDRDPLMFNTILNYLRTRRLCIYDLTYQQQTALRRENDFYGILSLDAILNPPSFFTIEGAPVYFNRARTVVGARNPLNHTPSKVMTIAAFSPVRKSMSLRIESGTSLYVGIAPHFSNKSGICGDGAFCPFSKQVAGEDTAGGESPLNIAFPITLTLSLDDDFNTHLIINGVSRGVVINQVAYDFDPPLHLCVAFYGDATKVELLH